MIKEISFNEKNQLPIVLVLGYFDCIHLGHIALIERAKNIADIKGATTCVFTFLKDKTGNVSSKNSNVLTYEERKLKLDEMGVECILTAEFNQEFKKTKEVDFFNLLNQNFNISAVVCGFDYTFGFKKTGNAETLKCLCKDAKIDFYCLDSVNDDDGKISTTKIKQFLVDGKIKEANKLLKTPYFIMGKVEKGRQIGSTLGFPTANISICDDKFVIKKGVYKTFTIIDGIKYSCLTNYGIRPTYELNELLTETHVIGFDGNLYDKTICVYFEDYIREEIKFESEEKLKKQLKIDLESVLK